VRLLGKRTLSKVNPGDFVITVAIGSVAGSLILFGEISVAQGIAALAALLGLQFRLFADVSAPFLALNGRRP
jgi:uncharacterized membrane protein YcaP (DUF421 family)